jgi:hypothetical protein
VLAMAAGLPFSPANRKRVVLTRKNSLFVSNPRGGRTAAILASLPAPADVTRSIRSFTSPNCRSICRNYATASCPSGCRTSGRPFTPIVWLPCNANGVQITLIIFLHLSSWFVTQAFRLLAKREHLGMRLAQDHTFLFTEANEMCRSNWDLSTMVVLVCSTPGIFRRRSARVSSEAVSATRTLSSILNSPATEWHSSTAGIARRDSTSSEQGFFELSPMNARTPKPRACASTSMVHFLMMPKRSRRRNRSCTEEGAKSTTFARSSRRLEAFSCKAPIRAKSFRSNVDITPHNRSNFGIHNILRNFYDKMRNPRISF